MKTKFFIARWARTKLYLWFDNSTGAYHAKIPIEEVSFTGWNKVAVFWNNTPLMFSVVVAEKVNWKIAQPVPLDEIEFIEVTAEFQH